MDKQYYNHYGLHQDPFAGITDDKEYFITAELEHRIELIKHLIEFSDRILVITGEVGAGKTSLLNHLLHSPDEKWQLCQLSFNDINTTDDFFQQLYQDQRLTFSETDSYASKTGALHEYFINLQDKGYVPVLFIDDAHYLSIEILKLLFELAINPQDKPALHIVLFSETNIAQLINHQNLGFVHSLDMPMFDEQQTADYLMHRLSHAGYQGDSIIEQKLINNIHKTSNGMPGLINELSSRALQDPAIHQQETDYLALIKSYALNPRYTLPAALVLLSVFIAYVLQTDDSSEQAEVRSSEIALPEQTKLPMRSAVDRDLTTANAATEAESSGSALSEPTPIESVAPQSIQSGDNTAPTVAETIAQSTKTDRVLLNTEGEIIYEADKPPEADSPPADEQQNLQQKPPPPKQDNASVIADAPEPEPVAAQTKPSPAKTAKGTAAPSEDSSPPELIQDIAAPEPKLSTATPPTASPDPQAAPTLPPTPEPQTPEPKKPEPVAENNSVSPTDIRGADWLKRQAAEHYVLQLMGAHDDAAMNKFIGTLSEYRAQLAKFTTVNQNKAWHVLVYGSYRNREQAVAAIDKLPPVLRDLKPWPRKIATIQEDL